MNLTKLRYDRFFRDNPTVALRTIDRLRAIDAWLGRPLADGGAAVPPKDSEDTLLLATWNLRDFGRPGARGYGARTLEPLFYIAAVISAFDLVALQEINEDLDMFQDLMEILGPDWRWIATDAAPGRAGNDERMVFVYDARKIRFRSIAGEITLLEEELIRVAGQDAALPAGARIRAPDGTTQEIAPASRLLLPAGATLLAGRQFARTPFMVSFQAGWFRFNLCTVHMLFGDGAEGMEQRVKEIATLARVFRKRAEQERRRNRDKGRDESADEAIILLGDFNITRVGHETMNALLDNGFAMPSELQHKPTNMFQTNHYDQIAILEGHGMVRPKPGVAGVLDVFQVVYRASAADVAVRKPGDRRELPLADTSDFEAYFEEMGRSAMRDVHKKARSFDGGVKVRPGDPRTREQAREWYASEWRSYQISDHLPMWTALEVDFRAEYLERAEREARERA